MNEIYTIDDILVIDEFVNDFEFAEHVYKTGISGNNSEYSKLVWADFF